METFALLHAAIEYETPGERCVRSLPEFNGLPPTVLTAGIMSATVFAASLAITEPAQALMRRGDRGAGVRQLQQELGIYIDGIYGAGTTQAVRNFQQRNGLQVDGVAGRATLTALGLASNLSAASSTSGSGDPGGSTVPVSGTTYVNAAVLNVRTNPSLNAPVSYVLYRGAQVSLTGATRSSNGYQWSQLSTGGWVASTHLSGGGTGGSDGDVVVPVAGTAYIDAYSGVNVRSAPGGSVISSRKYGQAVSLTGARQYADRRYWVQIGSGGWVAEDYIAYSKSQLG